MKKMRNVELIGLIADISVIGWVIFLFFAFACAFVVEYNRSKPQEEEEELEEEKEPQIVQFIDVRLPENGDVDNATITVQENDV